MLKGALCSRASTWTISTFSSTYTVKLTARVRAAKAKRGVCQLRLLRGEKNCQVNRSNGSKT